MIEPALPLFRPGQRVAAAADLHNDGSYPDTPEGVLLVAAGIAGEVVQVGLHVKTGTNVYMVEFAGGPVVGCLEEELAAAEADAATEMTQGETP